MKTIVDEYGRGIVFAEKGVETNKDGPVVMGTVGTSTQEDVVAFFLDILETFANASTIHNTTLRGRVAVTDHVHEDPTIVELLEILKK